MTEKELKEHEMRVALKLYEKGAPIYEPERFRSQMAEMKRQIDLHMALAQMAENEAWWASTMKKVFWACVLGALCGLLFGCATPAQVQTPPATKPAAVSLPACGESTLGSTLQVADGGILKCVNAEGPPSPRWEQMQ